MNVRRTTVSAILACAAVLGWTGNDQVRAVEGASPTEYEIKAAFLYNFTKYVVWPPESFPDERAPLTLCVVGQDPFGALLDDTVKGETVQEHPIRIRRIARLHETEGCHLVFVADGTSEDIRPILRPLESKPVLTVGEIDGFAERGGIINLRKRENRVALEINAEAARRAGLRISSQLLKLGTIVASSE